MSLITFDSNAETHPYHTLPEKPSILESVICNRMALLKNAIRRGDLESVKRNWVQGKGETALWLATTHGQLAIVRYLIEECDINPKARSPLNYSLDSVARLNKHNKVADYLLTLEVRVERCLEEGIYDSLLALLKGEGISEKEQTKRLPLYLRVCNVAIEKNNKELLLRALKDMPDSDLKRDFLPTAERWISSYDRERQPNEAFEDEPACEGCLVS